MFSIPEYSDIAVILYMRTETDTPAWERYLIGNFLLSGTTIKKLKAGVEKFMADREKDECYRQFMDWKQKENEIAVLTMYAYADLLVPKKFDTIFHIDLPQDFLNTAFTITQVVLDGYMPSKEISHGHKHVTIIQFDGPVPDIFRLLPEFDNRTVSKNAVELGFCNSANFAAIADKERIQNS